MKIPFHRATLGIEEETAVVNCLKTKWIAKGKLTKQFEDMFADYIGCKYAVGLNSCTAGLQIGLRLIGGKGSVITTPYTFCATVDEIENAGMTPRFVDVGEDYQINASALKDLLDMEDIKAVIPVHFAGFPADMGLIKDFVNLYQGNVRVIEDSAHTVMPKQGVYDMSTFSFYATKVMTCGDGGMFCTNNEVDADRARKLSMHGLTADAWNRYGGGSWVYDITEVGFKDNMNDIMASIAIEQLKKNTAGRERRVEISASYYEQLYHVEGVQLPPAHPDHSWHLFIIRVANRDKVYKTLVDAGIGCSVHCIPVHTFTYYKEKYGYKPEDFPVACKLFNESISLPIFPDMTIDEITYVCETLKKAVK